MQKSFIFLALTFLAVSSYLVSNPLDSMKLGINIGNDLETPGDCGSTSCGSEELCLSSESSWEDFQNKLPNNTDDLLTYFKVYQSMGIDTVRIPIRWGHHIVDENSKLPVDPAWLSKVNMTVAAALEVGLYVLINAHHDIYIQCNSCCNGMTFNEKLIVFGNIWGQVLDTLKTNTNFDNLLVEIYNEPSDDMTTDMLNQMHKLVYQLVRGKNLQNIVIFSGGLQFSNPAYFNGEPDWTIPGKKWDSCDFDISFTVSNGVRDPNIAVEVHSYNDWEVTSGSRENRDIRTHLQGISCWSAMNDNVKIILGETGCRYKSKWGDQTSFVDPIIYDTNVIQECQKYGIIPILWDDNGSFRLMDRNSEERTVSCTEPSTQPITTDVQQGYYYCYQIFNGLEEQVYEAPNCTEPIQWYSSGTSYTWNQLHSICQDYSSYCSYVKECQCSDGGNSCKADSDCSSGTCAPIDKNVTMGGVFGLTN